MLYISIFAHFDTKIFTRMLMAALPQQETGFGHKTSRMSENGDIHDVIPANALSNAEFELTLKNTVFDHVEHTDNVLYGLGIKKHRAKKINDVNSALTEVALIEQQKEMSVDFFDSLSEEVESKTPPVLNQFNYKSIKISINTITESFLIMSNESDAIALIKRAGNMPNDANSEHKILDYISHDPMEMAICKFYFDACALSNLLDTKEWNTRASRLVELWLLKALVVNDLRINLDKVTCLDQETNDLGIIIATAAFLFSKSSLDGSDRNGLKAIIESKLSKQNIFPFFNDTNVEKIKTWLNTSPESKPTYS